MFKLKNDPLRNGLLSAACLAAASISMPVTAESNKSPVCVYVSSYHQGYAWSDGVERGLRETLGDVCTLVQYDMDTKRKKTPEDIIAAGKEALELIQSVKPDVVITSDDNAAKYLIVPYLKNTDTPVVFSGVNWTVEEYDFPALNVTGIVEVAPIKPMLERALQITDDKRNAVYVGASTLTEQKNYARIKATAERMGISLDLIAAEDFDAWKNALAEAQAYDFTIMGSYSGIKNWDDELAAAAAKELTKTPSLTNHGWMMPFSLVGYTKIPEEHGEWAAQSAIAILSGVQVLDIPIVTNRKWDTWVNSQLLESSGLTLEDSLMTSAKLIQ
jgi:ABC-type uncharacterized transport system substrate-binding protein